MQSGLDPDQIKAFLKTSALFHDVDEASLSLLIPKLEFAEYKKGEPIVLENEICDHVYFIYSGTVEVVKQFPALKQVHRLAVLSPGHQFSDFSVLNRANKSASVYALEDCQLFKMSGDNFLIALRELPHLGKELAVRLAKMTRQIQTSQSNLKYVNKADVRFHSMIPQILPIKFWRKLGVLPIMMKNRSIHVAVKEPHNCDPLFILLKNSQPNIQIYLSLISEADFEIFEKELTSLYSDQPENQNNGAKPPLPNSFDIRTSLKSISLFSEIPDDWVEPLFQCLKSQKLMPGEYLYKHSTKSEKLYILLEGEIELSSPILNGQASTYVASYTGGDYLAEISLLTNTEHILSARATTEVNIVSLDKEYFDRFLEASFFSIPLAKDLANQFKSVSTWHSYKLYDGNKELQVKALSHLLPLSVVHQYQILPIRLQDNELTIGTTNPESETIYSVIGRYLHNYRIALEIIQLSDFKKWVQELGPTKQEHSGPTGRETSANLSKSDPVSILNKVLQFGFDGRASDIHLEPTSENFSVRYRVDGVLVEGEEKYSKELGTEVINRIKVLCSLDTTNKFTPQDGQMKFEADGSRAYARVSTLPTKNGESVVLRLIKQRQGVPQIEAVAPDRRVINVFRNVVNTKQGVFLVTGPTGSGKSTTLYSLLQELNRIESSIISLEDPVELEIHGVTQVEINEKHGLNFSTALRSALRQDPNVIMIGEIRDEESAKIAFHAASTGHLVISTLHTNDSLNIVPRLVELGVSYSALASTLIGASAQRLIRKLCEECRVQSPISELETETLRFELPEEKLPTHLYHSVGCTKCRSLGYHDRLPVIEIWQKTKTIEQLLLNKASTEEITEELKAQKFDTLKEFAFKMVINGMTTIEEVTRGLGGVALLNPDQFVDHKIKQIKTAPQAC